MNKAISCPLNYERRRQAEPLGARKRNKNKKKEIFRKLLQPINT